MSLNSGTRSQYHKLEDVIGCKWSVAVLQAIAGGTQRPGQLEREITGISTKVLSERLRKLSQYGLISREVFPEIPPRVEYSLTEAGNQLSAIIQQIHQLDGTLRERVPGK